MSISECTVYSKQKYYCVQLKPGIPNLNSASISNLKKKIFCVGSTVKDICVKFHVIIVIGLKVTLFFVKNKKCFFRFLHCLILLNKEVALNFVCGMKFLLQKRWGCCRRPSVTRLYRKQEHSSGIKCSEKTENALKTKRASDENKHQLMINMSWESKIWYLKIVN